jgi:histone deacetylase 1/2
MEQPQGFIDKSRPEFVCRLHKSLYGLKQTPQAWFQIFSTHLLNIGFQESFVDHSLFTLQQTKSKLCVLVYVDDIILIRTNNSEIKDFIKQL